MPICPTAYLKNHSNCAKFCVHIAREYRGSALLRQQCNTLCTSGCVEDVADAHIMGAVCENCTDHFSAYAQCTWAKALSAFFTTLQITDSIRHGTSFAVYLYPVANIACAKKLGFMVRVSWVSVRVRLSELSQRRIGHWALVLRMSLNSLTHLSAVGDSTGIEKRCMWNLSSNYVTGQHCHTIDNAFCCSC